MGLYYTIEGKLLVRKEIPADVWRELRYFVGRGNETAPKVGDEVVFSHSGEYCPDEGVLAEYFVGTLSWNCDDAPSEPRSYVVLAYGKATWCNGGVHYPDLPGAQASMKLEYDLVKGMAQEGA